MTQQAGHHPLYDFFLMFAEAMGHFRHATAKMPKANVDGCVVRGIKGKAGQGKVEFSFVDKKLRVVKVKLDMRAMQADPKGYIDSTLEGIRDTMAHADHESRIIVPVTSNKRILQLQQAKKQTLIAAPRQYPKVRMG